MASPRIKRDPADLVQFSISISKKGHQRLRDAAQSLGVGQDHILTVLLETTDFELLRPAINAYLARHRAPKFEPADIKAYLSSLTPEERRAMLEGDFGER